MSDLLEAIHLSKGFRSGTQVLRVLEDLSLEVAEGEMVAVTGVSGSGKSTLLHLLGGMDRPDSGTVTVGGTDLGGLDRRGLAEFRNRTVGFVFQFHHLLPEFTALENTAMPLLIRGEQPGRARAAAASALADVGLAERAQHRPGALSGGEQQRVALARALVGAPRLLLADEPTGNLDPHTGDAIAALFVRLHADRGLTSLIVTHNDALARMCSKAYRLVEGKLCAVDPRREPAPIPPSA
jgi:lipoprotein-releasing system ATP-binding protein